MVRIGERQTQPRKKLNGKKPRVIKYCGEDQVKYELFCIHKVNSMYLKWTPTSDEFENVIEVFYDFTLVRLHGSPASPSLLLSSLRMTECESTTKCSFRSGVNPSQACLSVRIPEERISLGLGAFQVQVQVQVSHLGIPQLLGSTNTGCILYFL